MFNFVLGLVAFGIVATEFLLFWPWSAVAIGILVAVGVTMALPPVWHRTSRMH